MLTVVIHRESLESQDLLAPVVSVDLLDPWDPLVWLEPPERLDVRCVSAKHNNYAQVNPVKVFHQLTCCVFGFREPLVMRELLVAMEPLDPR